MKTPSTFPIVDVAISPCIRSPQSYDDNPHRVIRLYTRLRKRDVDGRIYPWTHVFHLLISEDDYQDHNKLQTFLTDTISRFNSEIYKTMLFGRVNAKLRDASGYPVFLPDADQTDEEDRMRKFL